MISYKYKKLYMAVTADEYELPLCVRDSVEELAEVFGVQPNTIYVNISRNQCGKNMKHKFVVVNAGVRKNYRKMLKK